MKMIICLALLIPCFVQAEIKSLYCYAGGAMSVSSSSPSNLETHEVYLAFKPAQNGAGRNGANLKNGECAFADGPASSASFANVLLGKFVKAKLRTRVSPSGNVVEVTFNSIGISDPQWFGPGGGTGAGTFKRFKLNVETTGANSFTMPDGSYLVWQ